MMKLDFNSNFDANWELRYLLLVNINGLSSSQTSESDELSTNLSKSTLKLDGWKIHYKVQSNIYEQIPFFSKINKVKIPKY